VSYTPTGQLDLLDLGHPEMPTLDLSRCHTRPISHLTAARMVERFHYAHRAPSIVAAVGMYVDDVLAGCITYGINAVPNVHRCCGEEYRLRSLELNRLFIHDWAGRNSESWLIGQSFRWLQDKWPQYVVLVSYADTGHGHHGGIYRATNWLWTGLSSERCEGFQVGRDTIHAKHMNNRHGTRSVAAILKLYPGAVPISGQPKHRYVQFLGDRRQKRVLRAALKWPVLPYPKNVATVPEGIGPHA
jgi:hypothetical protein